MKRSFAVLYEISLLFRIFIFMTKDTKNLSDALKDLEKIAEKLDRSDLDIQESLKEFRSGVELIEFCRAELRSAENEFIELKSRLDTSSKKIEESVNINLDDIN